MEDSLYKVVDREGLEMPLHYSGRHRTYKEAKRLIESLNKHGEYSPYSMISVKYGIGVVRK